MADVKSFHAVLNLNARVFASYEKVKTAFFNTQKESNHKHQSAFTVRTMECFAPGRPNPTFRFTGRNE